MEINVRLVIHRKTYLILHFSLKKKIGKMLQEVMKQRSDIVENQVMKTPPPQESNDEDSDNDDILGSFPRKRGKARKSSVSKSIQ